MYSEERSVQSKNSALCCAGGISFIGIVLWTMTSSNNYAAVIIHESITLFELGKYISCFSINCLNNLFEYSCKDPGSSQGPIN